MAIGSPYIGIYGSYLIVFWLFQIMIPILSWLQQCATGVKLRFDIIIVILMQGSILHTILPNTVSNMYTDRVHGDTRSLNGICMQID